MDRIVATSSLKLSIVRSFASLFRFGSLRVAKLAFENSAVRKRRGMIATRMFGGVLPVVVERSNTHKLLALEGERFIEERNIVSALVNPGEVVVDVGANIGYYTLLLNQKTGPKGRVIAIEPEPQNLKELRRTIEVNNLKTVTLVPFALGGEDKDVNLAEGVNGTVCEEAAADTISVAQRKLDTLLDQLDITAVQMIKIDIEGYEWHALQGMQNVLKAARPRLFIEVHPALLPKTIKASDIVNLLAGLYSDLRIYVSSRNLGFLSKVWVRYRGCHANQHLTKERMGSFVEAADDGRFCDPFWLVCRAE